MNNFAYSLLIIFLYSVRKVELTSERITSLQTNLPTTGTKTSAEQFSNDPLAEFLRQLLQYSRLDVNNENDLLLPLKQGNTSSTVPYIEESTASSHRTITSQCDYDAERKDCGFPGITPMECAAKQCCWDDRTSGTVWCFFRHETKIIQDGSHLYRIAEIDEPLNMTAAPQNTTSFSISTSPSTQRSTYSFEEQQFLSSLEDELRSLNLTTEPVQPNATDYEETLNATSDWVNTDQMTKAVTATIATTESVNSPSFERNQGNEATSSNMPSAFTTANPNSLTGFQELAALIKFVEELERHRARIFSVKKKVQKCSLDKQDSCCRLDPASPCCKFHQQPPIAYRAAPITRIVGGSPAGSLRSSMAHLSRGSSRHHFCGGTLISTEWVLTAAHCVLEYCYHFRPASELIVSLGKYHKAPFHRDIGQQDFLVADVICHPNQCKSSTDEPRLNDVALLRLVKPATITQHVNVALMPDLQEQPHLNRNCIAMGWGRTRGSGYDDVLKQVSIPVISNQKCNRPNWRNCIVKSCMLCAGDVNIDPCDGDSGGPLFCQRPNGLYVLHGVYSWGRCGANRRKPSIYMRTSFFVEWIARTTQRYPSRLG